MRNLYRHIALIVAVVVIVGYQIFPPDKQLKLAKDLAGGTSLIYQVETRPSDPIDTVDKVIELLRKRVDPDGVLDITMVKQGGNRIEISMPMPGKTVAAARKKFEDALAKLGEGAVTAEQLRRIMNRPAADRDAEFIRLASGDAQRLALLKKAAEAFDGSIAERQRFNIVSQSLSDTLRAAQADLDAAVTARKPEEELKLLRDRVDAAGKALSDAALPAAQADIAYDTAERAALATSISSADVRRALELPGKARTYTRADGTSGVIASPRERALDRIKKAHPDAAARLDAVIAEYNTFQQDRKTLDDPQDLVRLLRGAGVLTFRIVPKIGDLPDEARLREELRAGGPRSVKSDNTRWLKINKIEAWLGRDSGPEELEFATTDPRGYFQNRGGYIVDEFDGQAYMLCYDAPGLRLTPAEGAWRVAGAHPSYDQYQQPAIAFEMDVLGAQRMGELTGTNLQKPMAVILDDEVFTAPTIQSTISGSGQITGQFTPEEIKNISQTLAAGSLAAKLSPEPISQSTIGPQLGADNLERGVKAGILSLVLVGGFMIVYYYGCGLISVFALLINAVLILGLMAMNRAAFSLPGIAGLILTFGMAVDANVLIYERMREEMERGADFRAAVRLGYSRAMSSIIDGNVTTLIVCVVLTLFGTQEIKGFGIVMIIGGLTTLFTQLYVTRVIFSIFVDKLGWRHGTMMAVQFPAIARAFHPHIDWMKFRFVMLGISAAAVIASVGLLYHEGVTLFDNDFRGGTKVAFQLKKDAANKPMLLSRPEVEARIKQEAAKRAPSRSSLADFEFNVLVINPDAADRTKSNEFAIKTVVTDTEAVTETVSAAMRDVLDIQPRLAFKDMQATDARLAPVKPILSPSLGDAIDKPGVRNGVADWVGGAAIVLEDLQPRPTLASLNDRLRQMRAQPEYARNLARPHEFIILDGDPEAVRSAVLLVRDDNASYLKDQSRWNADVRDAEWKMLVEAMSRESSLSSVENFSSSIATAFALQATIAVIISAVLITIYIWVRFLSFRYSLGALMSTLHDCIVALGCIAACEYVSRTSIGQALGISAFKIDLNVVAAVLTILGYSLNDTVIVMDRIRELRGKLPIATHKIVNDAINQTVSRTVITSGCTMLATVILYIFGGEAIRPFAFTFMVGVITGTYSSIFIAAPIVYSEKADPTANRPATSGASAAGSYSNNGAASATVAP
ncbi:MAG: protein translocase subunit SecD [Phycisphaerales bacterium]